MRNMHVAAYGVYSCLRKTSRSERRVLAEILKFFKIIQFRSTFIYSLGSPAVKAGCFSRISDIYPSIKIFKKIKNLFTNPSGCDIIITLCGHAYTRNDTDFKASRILLRQEKHHIPLL